MLLLSRGRYTKGFLLLSTETEALVCDRIPEDIDNVGCVIDESTYWVYDIKET